MTSHENQELDLVSHDSGSNRAPNFKSALRNYFY